MSKRGSVQSRWRVVWRRVQPVWPFAAVIAHVTWATWWLWHVPGHVFAGDNLMYSVKHMALIEVMGKAIANGHFPTHAEGYAYPDPVIMSEVTDYSSNEWLLASLAAAVTDFPTSYGLSQGMWIMLLALSVALLARGVGCRGWGIVVAGCLAAANWPYWHNVMLARGNILWGAVSVAGVASALYLVHWGAVIGRKGSRAGLSGGLWWMAALAVAGGSTLSLYPPLALLWLIPTAVWLLPMMRRRPAITAWALSMGLLVGILLAAGDLSQLLSGVRPAENEFVFPGLCPSPQYAVRPAFLTLIEPLPQDQRILGGPTLMMFSGAPLGAWVLAPLALAWRRRRFASILLLACMGAFLFLSLGPCPTAAVNVVGVDPLVAHVPPEWLPFWENVGLIRDFGRFLMIALLVAAVLSGWVVHRLCLMGWVGRAAGVTLGGLAIAHSSLIVHAETHRYENWQEAGAPVTATFLANQGGEPAVELPFCLRDQYLSVMHFPDSPRVNPLGNLGHSPQPFIRWLRRAGVGDVPDYLPTVEEIQSSGVRWAFYDRRRCIPATEQNHGTCGPELKAALLAAFGEPGVLGGGVLYWDLEQLAEVRP